MQNINLDKVVVLITAGGSGLRLWPLSTAKKPKQFCSLISEKTMLQLTLERVADLVPIQRTFVVTCTDQVNLVKQQLPTLQNENIIVEPEARDTAPAIGYAAVYIESKIPDATMVLVAADQHISPIQKFQESILKSIEVAQNGNYLVSVGIAPTKPHTEYGYMECSSMTPFGASTYYGVRYVEKPDLDTANKFLQAENYLWNTNIFVWNISNLLEAFKIYQPNAHAVLRHIQKELGNLSFQELMTLYGKLEKISIDYAILEKVKVSDLYRHIFVVGSFDWSDVGNFTELANTMEVERFGNRCKGLIEKSETENCVLISEWPNKLHVKGVSNLTIVVNEQGDILVSKNDSTKKIKELLKLPVNINFTNQGKDLFSYEKDINGNILMGTTILMNAKELVYRAVKNNIFGAIDVQNLAIKVRKNNISVSNKKIDLNKGYAQRMEILIEEDYDRMSEVAAASLVEDINKVISVKGKAVVVLSAGKTPEKTYSLLRTRYKNKVDWSKLVLFQMDDYLGLSSNHPQSFAYYLLKQLIEPLSIGKYYFFNKGLGDEIIDLSDYETKIQAEDGIDIIVHGIGVNGHLGFNEPGSSFTSKARIVDLAASTIEANSKAFNSVDEVPQKAVTLGLNILSQGKKIFLLAAGKEKQFAVRSSIFGSVTEEVPGSILQTSPCVKFILDRKACSWIKSEFSKGKTTTNSLLSGRKRHRKLVYAD